MPIIPSVRRLLGGWRLRMRPSPDDSGAAGRLRCRPPSEFSATDSCTLPICAERPANLRGCRPMVRRGLQCCLRLRRLRLVWSVAAQSSTAAPTAHRVASRRVHLESSGVAVTAPRPSAHRRGGGAACRKPSWFEPAASGDVPKARAVARVRVDNREGHQAGGWKSPGAWRCMRP